MTVSRHATSWKLATMLALGAVTPGCAAFGWTKPPTTATGGADAAPSGMAAFTSKFTALFSWTDSKKDPPKRPGGPKRIDPDTDAALSLKTKPKAGPDVKVAMARMLEQAQKPREAEKQYKLALELDPKYMPALEGLAHLEDRESHFDEAIAAYRKAIAVSPKEGSLHNDLGLCLQRRRNLPEAAKELEEAVRLQSDQPMYRNNLATVYVEMNRPDAALEQLIAASGPATGHYNLGYLLMRKGDEQLAIAEFRAAMIFDPSCAPARQWLAKLENSPNNSPRLARSATSPPLGGGTPPPPVALAPVAPAAGYPQAPSAVAAPPITEVPQSPPQNRGMSYPRTYSEGNSSADAPLPPGNSGESTYYQPVNNGAQPAPLGAPASPPPSTYPVTGPQLGPSARRLVPANPPLQ